MPAVKQAAIRVQNCYSWLYTNCPEVKETLWKALRFRERNYFHSRLYKQKLWDGYTDYFSLKSGRFLTGLLPEVEAALKHLDVRYRLVDERTCPKLRFESIDQNFMEQWNTSGKLHPLYDYQVPLVNQSIKIKRGVIFSPTSSGKTLCMMAILKCLKENTPALLLVNRKSAADQNYEELVRWGFKNIGRLYDKYTEPNVITCACVQSLHKIERLLPHVQVLIVDEIHDMMSKVPRRFYNKLTGCGMRIAVSATPFKFGGKDKSQKYAVKGYFGPVLTIESEAAEGGILKTKKLQERGTLSKANCTFYPITQPDLAYAIYQDAVERGLVQNYHFHEIVKRLAISQTGRTLILVERLLHGDILHEMIPGSVWVQGKDDLETRKEAIHQLQIAQGDIIVIATQGIFNTAVNFFCHNLINAASGQAEHVIIQRFGRGLRVAQDKEVLNYYDFIFAINEYLFDHSKNRIKTLKGEGHNVVLKKVIDF